MAYGILKCDNITFDNGGSDQNVTVSGLYRATTSGVTVSGTIAAGTVSGVTVIGSTTVSGATVTGTTANFTSGNFSNIISSAATMSGALIMANQQQVRFREAVGNGVNHIALQAPAIVSADQTITLPDQTGTVVTTGDNGSVTSTMILDGTILNADINASAAIADTKLATISTAGKVSGTAITSGNIATSGNLAIASNAPSVTLEESDGTATHSQAALVKNDDSFQIQTRSGAGVFVSQDYAIATNASGATDHLWRIAGTEKARLNSAGLTVVNDLTISDKIIHAGDTNTAIRFPAVDTVTVETNGAERLRIDSSGRVGIGTPSDGPKLLVYGNGTTANTLSVVNPSATNGAIIYLGDSNQSSAIKTIPAGGTHSLGFFVAGSNTERLRIDSSGNVGIGTSSPGYALDVAAADTTASTGYAVRIRANATAGAGALQFTDSAATVQYGLLVFDANGVGTLQAEGASSRLAFGTNATERLRIDSSGSVGIGTSSPSQLLHVNGGQTRLSTSPKASSNTCLTLGTTDATNPMELIFGNTTNSYWSIQSVEQGVANRNLAINPSGGNVGIGTSSPGVKLHVADGQIRVANSGAINPSLVFTGNGAGASGFQVGQRYNAQELFIYDLAALADRVVVDSAGRVGIGTTSPTMLLDINNDTVRVRTARTPASASATGATGEICWDANYIYVCTATNTWKRSALSTW
jgi:hypothetical protein